MEELINFLNMHNVNFTIKNGRIHSDVVDLSNKNITIIPDSIEFLNASSLRLNNNQIEVLPKTFHKIRVNNLYLNDNKLTELDEQLTKLILRSLYITNNPISKIPDNFFNNINILFLYCDYFNENFLVLPFRTKRLNVTEITENSILADGVLQGYTEIITLDEYKFYVGYVD